jgi:hypothetical protein
MINEETTRVGGRRVLLMDSIALVSGEDEDQIVVSASHGGKSSGEYALRVPLAAVFFNDAGVGKDAAGIAALGMLQERGIPAGTYSHDTARIGDARDAWANGVLSHVNGAARAAGLDAGMSVHEGVEGAFADA